MATTLDYDNSHFVALDALGDVGTLTDEQIDWLDDDLSEAESRAWIEHTFIYFHGPIYPVGYHCHCTDRVCALDQTTTDLIDVIN